MSISLQEVIARQDLEAFDEEELQLHGINVNGTTSNPTSPSASPVVKVKYNYELDHTLLIETTAANPYKYAKKWEEISKHVSAQYRSISKDQSAAVTSRSCRDRIITLFKDMNSNDGRNLKRGCTEDQYLTKLSLLEGLLEMKNNAESQTKEKAKQLESKAKVDKQKGENIREAAMNTHTKRAIDGDQAVNEGGKKRRSASSSNIEMWEYLQTKNKEEKGIKEKQLALEERRLQLEEKKAEDERAERQRYWSNVEADRVAQLQKQELEAKEKLLLFDLLKNLSKK